MEEKYKSDVLYIMKFFAVISIVFAHSLIANVSNDFLRSFLSIFKCVGVYIFLILSGYFFNYRKYKNLFELLISKLINIVIPWVFCGLLVYFSRFISQPFKLDFFEIGNWLLGNGSYLYFLTMLFLIYVIIYLFPKKDIYYYLFIGFTLISIFLTQINVFSDIVNLEKFALTYLNPYLNLFNWIGIFCLGLILRKYDLFNLKIDFKILFLLLIFCVLIIVCFKIDSEYWSLLTFVTCIMLFFVFFEISKKMCHMNLFVNIGKSSFAIYLLHLPIISKLCRMVNPIYSLFAAIFTVFLLYYILFCIKKISEKIHIKKLFVLLSGAR